MNVDDLIQLNEGDRYKPYKDTVGKITIGRGRNLDDVGISHTELLTLFENDKKRATDVLAVAYPWFAGLSEARQAACIDLIFNLGAVKLRQFVRFLAAMAQSDWPKAAQELRDSSLYTQATARTTRNMALIEREEWPK